MKALRRSIRLATVGLGVLVAVAYLALPWLARTDFARRRVAGTLSSASGWDVRVERFGVGWSLEATLAGVTAHAAADRPFLRAERVRARPGLLATLRGRLARVEVDEPVLILDALPPGRDGRDAGPLALPADAVVVREGWVQPEGDDDARVGPLGFTVDSLRAGRVIEIGGREDHPGRGLHVRWTARLGAALETMDATIRVRVDEASAPGIPTRATIAVEGSPRGRLDATLRATVAPPDGEPVRVSGGGSFDVAERSGRFAAALAGGEVALGGWRVAGAVEAPFRIDAGGVVATPSATGEFHDAASIRAGERIRLAGAIRASGVGDVDVDVGATAGEVLWDRLYLDLAARPVRVRGGLGWESGTIHLDSLVVSLADVASATLTAAWPVPDAPSSIDVDLDVPRLGPLFDLAVREPLGDARPILAGATVSGRLAGRLVVAGGERLAVAGRLRLEGVSAATTDPPLSIAALDADLPVSLGPGAPAPEDPAGRIDVAGFVLGGVRVGDLRAGVRVAPNEIRAAETVRVPLLGGHVDVTDFAARALDSPDRSARFGLAVRDVDLAALSAALAWPPLRGGASGAIPSVTVAHGAVRTEGEIDARVFDGRIRIRNLHADDLWSPVPAIGLDLDFDGISLGAMTEAFDVGQITGVVRGQVHGLSVVNGQPVRFEAEMESVPRDGVPQEISVRAIRQISIVAGPGGDALSSGILAFFDRYRYAKLGFRCSLENDRFLLRGIDEQDGKQVLVAGARLPPRVNVYSESRVIGFSEMVRRLRRAVETGAGEGGTE